VTLVVVKTIDTAPLLLLSHDSEVPRTTPNINGLLSNTHLYYSGE